MEEYLKTLLEQVRCKKAHALIEDEIRGHMEEQAEANMACGMSEEEAEKEAVRDMGSPVEAGISLDRIHRTKIAWEIVLLMALISIIGIVIHALIGNEGCRRFIFYTVVGFVVMVIIYRIDYSFLAKYAKLLAVMFLGAILLASLGIGNLGLQINGRLFYIHIGEFNISIFSIMMLFVPLYGAILYQYYGSGIIGIVKAIVWMVVPIILAFNLPSLSLAIILFFSMAVVLSFAVWKRWFQVSKKCFFIFFWMITMILPIILLICAYNFHWLASYQEARIRTFVGGTGEVDGMYLVLRLRSYLINSQLIGGNGQEMARNIEDFNSSFILTYLTSSYGLVIGFAVCGVLALLIVKIFSISMKQKNQLGMIMGCGCGMVFLSNIMINILANVGWLPVTQTFLPFFSSGGSNIIVSYVLIGIIMSIYRYKNIFPKYFKKKMKEVTP